MASVPSHRPQPQDLQEGDVDFAKNGISRVVMPQTPSQCLLPGTLLHFSAFTSEMAERIRNATSLRPKCG